LFVVVIVVAPQQRGPRNKEVVSAYPMRHSFKTPFRPMKNKRFVRDGAIPAGRMWEGATVLRDQRRRWHRLCCRTGERDRGRSREAAAM